MQCAFAVTPITIWLFHIWMGLIVIGAVAWLTMKGWNVARVVIAMFLLMSSLIANIVPL